MRLRLDAISLAALALTACTPATNPAPTEILSATPTPQASLRAIDSRCSFNSMSVFMPPPLLPVPAKVEHMLQGTLSTTMLTENPASGLVTVDLDQDTLVKDGTAIYVTSNIGNSIIVSATIETMRRFNRDTGNIVNFRAKLANAAGSNVNVNCQQLDVDTTRQHRMTIGYGDNGNNLTSVAVTEYIQKR